MDRIHADVADDIIIVKDNDISDIPKRFRPESSYGDSLMSIMWNPGNGSRDSRNQYIKYILRLFDHGQLHELEHSSYIAEGRVIRSHSGETSSISCPALTSDASTEDAAVDLQANSTTLQGTVSSIQAADTMILSTQNLKPLILASIRQVFAHDSSFAEEVVLGLKKLPLVKHCLFFNLKEDPGDSTPTPSSSERDTLAPVASKTTKALQSVLEENFACMDEADSLHQVSPDRSSRAKGGNRSSVKRAVQDGSAGKSKKVKLLDDDDKDQTGKKSGSGSGGGGKTSSTSTDEQDKFNSRWACPYCLAFAHMLDISRFKSCRPPGSMKSRSLWKDHLKEYHSPQARPPNPVADHEPFYMDEIQWGRVQDCISKSKHRPRRYDEWYEVQKKCFLDVWHIIFPEEQYPTLSEPVSPFHPDTSSVENLSLQIDNLFQTIRRARAERAVSDGSIDTVEDFHPTEGELMEMMREALAIMTNTLPRASQWITNISQEGMQAAVIDYNRDTSQNETENASSERTILPELTLNHPDPATATIPMDIPLSPWGTQIQLDMSPNYTIDPYQETPFLSVRPPPGFTVDGMRRIAAPLPPPLALLDLPTLPLQAEPDFVFTTM